MQIGLPGGLMPQITAGKALPVAEVVVFPGMVGWSVKPFRLP